MGWVKRVMKAEVSGRMPVYYEASGIIKSTMSGPTAYTDHKTYSCGVLAVPVAPKGFVCLLLYVCVYKCVCA